MRACVRMGYIFKGAAGDVFISFDLMTANGKSIKQNAPPLFVSSVPIRQMDNVAG